jgi:hypothetical protein
VPFSAWSGPTGFSDPDHVHGSPADYPTAPVTPTHRPPAAGSWLLAVLVALFAGSMVLPCVARWYVADAAWWTVLLLVGVVAWY